ncbi:putative V-type proton ATPase subunit B [Bienertia sinuspersici]
MVTPHRSGVLKRSNDGARLVMTTIVGIVFGFFIGVSFPSVSDKIKLSSRFISSFDGSKKAKSLEDLGSVTVPKIYVPTNPHGAEMLPPGNCSGRK